jgi:hypothetical protein
LEHVTGVAASRAQQLLSSRERLLGLSGQGSAQRLTEQADMAHLAAKQATVEADALEAMDTHYQHNTQQALDRAATLERRASVTCEYAQGSVLCVQPAVTCVPVRVNHGSLNMFFLF